MKRFFTLRSRQAQGFTLIELLIVIGIIAILAGIIYVAVDPARRLQEARDAERWGSVNAILNGVLKYTVDNQGDFPSALVGVDTAPHCIGSGSCPACAATTTISTSVDLAPDLVDEYLSAIPADPDTGNTTDYYIARSNNGRITVGACQPERPGVTISVTR